MNINEVGTYKKIKKESNHLNDENKEVCNESFNKELEIEYLDCCDVNYNVLKSSYQGEVKLNSIGRNSILIIDSEFTSGNKIKQITNSIFTLENKGIYQVSINIKGFLKDEGAITVFPRINGIIREEVSIVGNNNLSNLCASASGTFLIDAMEECLYLDFFVKIAECSTLISGNICIVQII